jgi:hypothetical protein
MKDEQESKGKRARRHKEFRIGENWTVLAETHGDGIGLPRGTKILVREAGDRLKLTALNGDWANSPVLERLDPPREDVDAGNEHCACDPVWHWEGLKVLEREDDTELHTIRVGCVANDPGVCVIFVNRNGRATIER